MAKAFSIEDGNLSNVPLTSSISRRYRDIDSTFLSRQSGDIFKKTDAAAVKHSIKNLLMTNESEKPFLPQYGGNLNSFLFSLSEEFDELDVKEQVSQAIDNFEPRARVREVAVDINPDANSINVTVIFQMVTTMQIETVQVSLTRLR